jgi:site-specific recombinase XerD
MQQSAIRILNPRPNSFIADWLGSLSPKTAEAYSSDLTQFWAWAGHEDPTAVTYSDCQRYLGHLKDSALRPASVNRKLAALRGMLAEAVRHQIIAANPAEGIRGFKTAGISERTSAPERAQVDELLASIDTDTLLGLRDRAILYLIGGLGLRRDEVVNLTVDSISESQGQAVLTVIGKGNKTRKVALSGGVRDAVFHWMAAARLTGGVPLVQGVVGRHTTGGKMNASSVYQRVRARLSAIGITDFSPHSFRSFFITEGIRNGCDPFKMQRAAGHSDPRTTQGYDQARDDVTDSAASYVGI